MVGCFQSNNEPQNKNVDQENEFSTDNRYYEAYPKSDDSVMRPSDDSDILPEETSNEQDFYSSSEEIDYYLDDIIPENSSTEENYIDELAYELSDFE